MTKIKATLCIDTREKPGYLYTFSGCESKHVDFNIIHKALGAADYGAALAADDPPAEWAVCERKTIGDLCGTLTARRETFEAELERLGQYGYVCIVVEGSIGDILVHCAQPCCAVRPQSIIASLVAFSQRLGIPTWFAGNRRHAEALTFRILERWCRDKAAALAAQQKQEAAA